ncbi:MAG: purine-nucleoside phosphorylase [Mycoplasma sp.]|nr:purine-nucleoside phosphorylase [Mycoplasma sp.]
MTPHINAKKDQIAKRVLMPGDPLRAKYIAEKFLENPKLVNTVRNMLFYTGTYKGVEVSICAHGMGQPSIGIYAFELLNFYKVDKIMRIGSSGSYKEDIKLYDLVLATSAYSESNIMNYHFNLEKDHILYPSKKLNDLVIETAKSLNLNLRLGQINSSDVFYSSIPLQDRIEQSQAIAVEMESYSLFALGKKFNKEVACLLTISDNLITKQLTTPEERETKFNQMMVLALETIIKD